MNWSGIGRPDNFP